MVLWKVAARALKTKGGLGRLLDRSEEEAFQCPLCQEFPEDTVHLLVLLQSGSGAVERICVSHSVRSSHAVQLGGINRSSVES